MTFTNFFQANEENGAMQFIDGSHKEGFFDHVQSTKEGNVLNENQDMIIPEKWNDKIVQTKLLPGQCTFHDGKFRNYLSILSIWCYLKIVIF